MGGGGVGGRAVNYNDDDDDRGLGEWATNMSVLHNLFC